MNRKQFLKTCIFGSISAPFISLGNVNPKVFVPREYFDETKHHQLLWTPQEIVDFGFVFTPYPSFIHDFDNPRNPIHFRDDPECYKQIYPHHPRRVIDNKIGVVVKCSMPGIKCKDINEYYSHKIEIDKLIVEYLKYRKYHYIYWIMISQQSKIKTDNPITWDAMFVRGAKELNINDYKIYG